MKIFELGLGSGDGIRLIRTVYAADIETAKINYIDLLIKQNKIVASLFCKVTGKYDRDESIDKVARHEI